MQEQELQQDFHDTTFLPFPRRNRKTKMDEQFGKFIEVIQKLYINIPQLDAIQVPTYVKYLRDILNNKAPLSTIEVIELMEEYSAVSVMPKKVFGMLNYSTLMPTSMCLQLANQSVRYSTGIAENIPVKV